MSYRYRTPPAEPAVPSGRDWLEALSDAFQIRAGLPVQNPHPLAEQAAEMPLEKLSAALECRALVSSAFGHALATGFRHLVATRYADNSAEYDSVFHDVVVKNLKAVEFLSPDVLDVTSIATTGYAGPLARLQTFDTSSGETGAAKLYSARVLINRTLLVNDDFGLIESVLAQLSAHAARLAPHRLAILLGLNTPLSDAQPLFGAENTSPVGGVTAPALGAASAMLRTMKSATGNLLDLKMSAWLVHPKYELTARAIVSGLGDDFNVKVIGNPWLSEAETYVVADPKQQPTIARLGVTRPIKPSIAETPAPGPFDGVCLTVEIALGLALVSRLGIVKIPVSE